MGLSPKILSIIQTLATRVNAFVHTSKAACHGMYGLTGTAQSLLVLAGSFQFRSICAGQVDKMAESNPTEQVRRAIVSMKSGDWPTSQHDHAVSDNHYVIAARVARTAQLPTWYTPGGRSLTSVKSFPDRCIRCLLCQLSKDPSSSTTSPPPDPVCLKVLSRSIQFVNLDWQLSLSLARQRLNLMQVYAKIHLQARECM